MSSTTSRKFGQGVQIGRVALASFLIRQEWRIARAIEEARPNTKMMVAMGEQFVTRGELRVDDQAGRRPI